MISGREPIPYLHRCSVIIALCTPSVCMAQGNAPPPEDTWVSPPARNPTGSEPAAKRQPTEGKPAEAEAPDDEGADFAEEAAMHWSGDPRWAAAGWDDYDREGMPAGAPPEEDSAPAHGHRLAPHYSLWLGAGLGWTLPFGSVWGTCSQVDSYGQCLVVDGVPMHDFVRQGPAAELDVGARFARNYNVYGLWEHSWLGAGSRTNDIHGQPDHGETDFLAVGLRVSTSPNDLGFLLDIAVGTRRMRAVWTDGTELQFTEAPFETRLGLGADVRLDEHWSLTPMIALGLGSFGKVQWVNPDHSVQRATQPDDVSLTHGWVGLQMAAHADIFGTR